MHIKSDKSYLLWTFNEFFAHYSFDLVSTKLNDNDGNLLQQKTFNKEESFPARIRGAASRITCSTAGQECKSSRRQTYLIKESGITRRFICERFYPDKVISRRRDRWGSRTVQFN